MLTAVSTTTSWIELSEPRPSNSRNSCEYKVLAEPTPDSNSEYLYIENFD